MVVTFVGISGSGKSRLADQFKDQGFKHICPDDIRKELTGDISNQSFNGAVFTIAHTRLGDAVAADQDVIFDVTNLKAKDLNQVIKIVDGRTPITIYVMEDSANIECCKMRISMDLEKGKDRARTAEDAILLTQQARFLNMQKLLFEDRVYDEVADVISYGGLV